jgi:4-hydroxy-tetrahydrodipicolinate reductase
MGRMLQACAAEDPDLTVVGLVDQGDDPATAVPAADVVIDFSTHEVTSRVVELCVRHGRALVIGTTGHTPAEKAAIAAGAARIPLVWSANYSTGVNLLFWLTRRAAEILGEGFDREIIELHHRHKKDAPSGTALRLAEILAEVRRQSPEAVLRHGRQGLVGERPPAEIGMHALRGGDVVGEHTVLFAAPGERVELTHRASSREPFARGALRAARWVVGRPPGLYDMQDVLGLK